MHASAKVYTRQGVLALGAALVASVASAAETPTAPRYERHDLTFQAGYSSQELPVYDPTLIGRSALRDSEGGALDHDLHGAVSAVPEPSALALLLVGVVVVGSALRRRRQ